MTCFSKYLDALWSPSYRENPFQTWQYFVSSNDITNRIARMYPGFKADASDCDEYQNPQSHISNIVSPF